jgi:ribose transport system ATP-binding protein
MSPPRPQRFAPWDAVGATDGGQAREPFLEARGIGKRYGAVRALGEVSFSIAPGEIVALVGENGSGKSTLAKILAGVISPDSGSLVVDGRPVQFGEPRHAVHAGITLVAQDPVAVQDMTLAENVMLGADLRPWRMVRRKESARLASPHLRRVGIDASPNTLVRSLAPGQRELVEVAKVLVSAPRLMILDEATARFGAKQVAQLFDLVREEVAGGMSVIIITHRLREVTELADRAVVLRDGVHVADLVGRDLRENKLSEAMVGRPRPAHIPHGHRGATRNVLEVRNVSIADDAEPISFDIQAGEIVGVAGLVGSGRTELLETIAGARRPLSGSISVEGQDITGHGLLHAIRRGVTLVPEDRHRSGLVMSASVRSNVALGSWAWGYTSAGAEERAARGAISRLRIKTPTSATPVRSLSGGNQQKVVIGRCLASKPKLLVLDDPTVGVDVGARDEIYELIAQLCREGMAVLMASSELSELLRLSDRICVMHERSMVGQLDAATATEEQIARLGGGGA